MNHSITEFTEEFYRIKPKDVPVEKACLYWSIAVTSMLKEERVILQAGTCLWPRLTPEQDDGVSNTHFGYVWESHDAIATYAMLGIMPEMHVWAAIPKTNTLIDLTTKYFPDQCMNLIREDWPGYHPPEYFWDNVNKLPRGVVYNPDINAMRFILFYLREIGGNIYDYLHL